MKIVFTFCACLLCCQLPSLEYELLLQNEKVHVARAKIMPYEEIGLHRDEYPHIVIALEGGTITRLEADGTKTAVHFPTGTAVYREVDPSPELHKSVNDSSSAIELLIIQLKNGSSRG